MSGARFLSFCRRTFSSGSFCCNPPQFHCRIHSEEFEQRLSCVREDGVFRVVPEMFCVLIFIIMCVNEPVYCRRERGQLFLHSCKTCLLSLQGL